jgi:hypothetical protein
MKRRQRKWTKGKLLKEPQKHPILGLWASPEVKKVMKKRGEEGLHFNDMRYLLCKDFKLIKKPPKEWSVFSNEVLKRIREYNDYTILQKDLTKLCEIGFLKKESRGYYTQLETPMMRYIQDLNLASRNLIGSADECDIVATENIVLPDEVENECGAVFRKIMAARAETFKVKILNFWSRVDSSKLDIQQKILLKSELFPFTQDEQLKKFIKKQCLITTKKGKESFDVPPFKKRNAEKMRTFIDITKKHSRALGINAVRYAMGMYTYPNIFTEKYISEKGTDFSEEMEPYIGILKDMFLEFTKPCYVLLAPR